MISFLWQYLPNKVSCPTEGIDIFGVLSCQNTSTTSDKPKNKTLKPVWSETFIQDVEAQAAILPDPYRGSDFIPDRPLSLQHCALWWCASLAAALSIPTRHLNIQWKRRRMKMTLDTSRQDDCPGSTEVLWGLSLSISCCSWLWVTGLPACQLLRTHFLADLSPHVI